MEGGRYRSWVPERVYAGLGGGARALAGPEALALSQGLLLWLLLGVAGVWASRGPLRPLCQPINATLAAEKEACPVCITFTTSICAGYCPSMVSCQGRAGATTSAPGRLLGARPIEDRKWHWGWKGGLLPGEWAGQVEGRAQRVPWTPKSGICGVQWGSSGESLAPRRHSSSPPSRSGCCLPSCRPCPSGCAPTTSCASPPFGSPAAHLAWIQWSPSPWPSAVTVGPAASAALTAGVLEPNPWPVTTPHSQTSSSSKDAPLQPPMPLNSQSQQTLLPSLPNKDSSNCTPGLFFYGLGCVHPFVRVRSHTHTHTHDGSSFRTILYKVTVSEL